MHRLVRQLESDGLLQRGVRGRLRGPGPRLVDFALDVLRYWAETAPRQAILQALSANVGETCNLGVMDGNAVVYIERVESKWPFGLKFEPGSRVPLHCTSMGKLFLSEMPEAKRRELLQVSTLHRYTENTICDAETLDREAGEIKKRGYSVGRSGISRRRRVPRGAGARQRWNAMRSPGHLGSRGKAFHRQGASATALHDADRRQAWRAVQPEAFGRAGRRMSRDLASS